MKLDEHYMRLIAIGAAVACNCSPCLEINLTRAKECGADEPEIAQAIWVGRMVRRGATSKMDEFIESLIQSALTPAIGADCGCES
jgi:AhpD family alkylhydroperoxidase